MSVDGKELRDVLEEAAQPGAHEVCALLPELCPYLFARGSEIQALRLKSRVFRVRSVLNGSATSVVLKCLNPSLAERNELLIRRWLPGIGLPSVAPALVGTIGSQRGTRVWHVYEDLGNAVLDAQHPPPDAVAAAVEVIAQLHTRAAHATLLPECHHHLGDLGMPYFVSNLRDAVTVLEALGVLAGTLTGTERNVRDRLLERLHTLLESLPFRAHLMREFGGPQTLLHGDLWTINTFVIPSSEGLRARLIDWDRAGVGPVAYDLSTFLYRFPAGDRSWILEHYRRAVGRVGWHLPDTPDLNVLFETAECARFANRIIWPTLALLNERTESGHGELAQILRWFEALEPVLPH
jgi:hypothetical protein